MTAVTPLGPVAVMVGPPPPTAAVAAPITDTNAVAATLQQASECSPEAVAAAQDLLHQERMEYIRQLVQEKERLSTAAGCEVARRLLEQELERVQSGRREEEKRTLEVTKEKSIKVTVKVLVPVREHPKFNFVGKLLGPKGNSLKRLQEETMTKMAILGRGSFRDKAKEEELRKNPDPKYSHLQEELHVEVTAHAPPAEAYARIAYALTEIRRYLVPDHNDEIRQEQMREMQLLNGRPAILGIDGGDTHTDTSGSLSPPNSISPPPAAPVKIPQAAAAAAAAAAAQLAAASPHPAAAQPTTFSPALMTHPAFRGLVPNIPTAAPTMAATTTMIGRFPTLFPFGTVPTLATQPRSLPMYEEYTELTSSMPQHEYDANLLNGVAVRNATAALLPPSTTNPTTLELHHHHHNLDHYAKWLVHESSADVAPTSDQETCGDDKKDAAIKAAASQFSRAKYRHDPYKRLTINVPS